MNDCVSLRGGDFHCGLFHVLHLANEFCVYTRLGITLLRVTFSAGGETAGLCE